MPDWGLMFRAKLQRAYATYSEYYPKPSVLRELYRNVFTRITNFDKDYIGQKEVQLSTGIKGYYTWNDFRKAEPNWINYLQNRETKIQTLYAFNPSQELLAAIAEQPQIRKLVIKIAKDVYDLSVLQKMSQLEYLEINQVPTALDFEPLVKCRNLRVLNIFARKPLNFESVGKLTQLEGLYFGAGSDGGFVGKWVKVDNLQFLKNLRNLKRLKFDVKPLDSDLSPLLNLKNLEEGWYVYFKGQVPAVEDMAKDHPAFEKVYENYLMMKSGDWRWGLEGPSVKDQS
jgi:hypothetical protein